MSIFTQLNEAVIYAKAHPEEVIVWSEDHESSYDLELFKKNFKGDVSLLMTPADVCMGEWELNSEYKIQEKEFSLIDGYWDKKIFALRGKTFLSLLDSNGKMNLTFSPELDVRGLPIPLLKGKGVPALFLDRDGVIIHDSGYVHKKEDVKIYEDVIPLIQWANRQNWKVCVLTNQAGIAYGKFGPDEVETLHHYINNVLEKEGAMIDGWYACPYVRSVKSISSFNFDSVRRKPNPGMLLDACQDFSIDVKKSVMVGDKESDVLYFHGPEYLLVRRQYDLASAQAPIFSSLAEIQDYLSKK